MREEDIQAAVVRVLQREQVAREAACVDRLLFSHPSQAHRLTRPQRIRAAALGVRRGLLDLYISDMATLRSGIMEIKTSTGSLSPEQLAHLCCFRASGVAVAVVESAAEAEAWLRAEGFVRCA